MNKFINFEEMWNRLKIELIVERKKAAAINEYKAVNIIDETLIAMEKIEENAK